jgi:hypothetical protein
MDRVINAKQLRTGLPEVPLADDPFYRAEACGRSADGFTSRDHDAILYRKRSK